jgi:Methionine biosynthesis protein MetW
VPDYGEDLAAIHAAGFTAVASAAARELLPRLGPASRVLDVGCGDGTTARLLSDAGVGTFNAPGQTGDQVSSARCARGTHHSSSLWAQARSAGSGW